VEIAQVVALLAFVVVAWIVAIALRRGGSILSRTRVAESFRGDVVDLAGRVGATLAEVIGLVDTVRRHAADPEILRPTLAEATAAMDGYLAEARALGGPTAARGHRDALIDELERATRALDLVLHGCDLSAGGQHYIRAQEVDTAIKRGYLNLVHAQESFATHAAAAVSVAEEASPARRLGNR
jgi:hypothetical protein